MITKDDFLARQLVMQRLLNIFGGMNGGTDFLDLRMFVEHVEGDTATRILKHMGLLLDAAKAADYVTIDDLPDWVKEKAETLE